MNKGLVHIYCGDGKGKTTAAMGLSIRAAGRDLKVLIVQFLKSQKTGELDSLKKIENIKVLRGDENCTFTFKMTDDQKVGALKAHMKILNEAIEDCRSGKVNLLVLDEIMAAYNHDLVDKEILINFIKNKPINLEIVMTGRNPKEELLNLADYISEIKKVKHPYDNGITARIGIEN